MSDRHALPPYSLRLPQQLRSKLQEAADCSRRSLNAEMVARLESSFSFAEIPEGTKGALDIENNAMLKAICAQLGIKAGN